jgi:hypothetical protein
VFLILLVIAAFFPGVSTPAYAAHPVLVCAACHQQGGSGSDPAAQVNRAVGCAGCHRGHERIFDHAMSQRSGEQQFVQRSFARMDSGFWEKNCTGCHMRGCLDCHAGNGLAKPTVAACQRCHSGYYTGWDYSGRAPREDNMRYQRGIAINGETFLKMLPDVHYRVGMTCGACHSMTSLAEGRKSSKVCRDCHQPDLNIIEHRISAHLERLECYACHSAWGAQEYGTFFLRFRERSIMAEFDLKPGPSAEYLRSAYLKKQDAPPLGLNAFGKISPIRPMFLAYYTDIMSARNNGPENVRLAAEWRAWFPHTVQRGSVTCEGCHDNPRRFLLEPESQRIYATEKDGLGLASFWLQQGQRVSNGSFVDAGRYRRLSSKTPAYKRAEVEKWQSILTHAAPSSRH